MAFYIHEKGKCNNNRRLLLIITLSPKYGVKWVTKENEKTCKLLSLFSMDFKLLGQLVVRNVIIVLPKYMKFYKN